MTWRVEEDFWEGFQNFLVKTEGVSKFCKTRGEGADLFGNDKPWRSGRNGEINEIEKDQHIKCRTASHVSN